MTDENSRKLLLALLAESNENEWLEFKANNDAPETMGERISALSNMAALAGRSFAYMVYGIDDKSKEIIGTTAKFALSKKGNELLRPWLESLIEPRLSILPIDIEFDGKKVTILRIPAARWIPTSFKGVPYCRIDSATKPLSSRPDIHAELIHRLESGKKELRIVMQDLSAEEVFAYLDLPSYYEAFGTLFPKKEEMLRKFTEEHFLIQDDTGSFSITLLGAICFAKNFDDFPSLSKRAIRLVSYVGINRIQGEDEQFFKKGYVLSFNEIVSAVVHRYRREAFQNAMRIHVDPYSEISLREALANLMIHGDLLSLGSGPLIEAFPNRLEFSNPGSLRFDVDRILDVSPDATNEILADFMHRIGIGDERGSGYDKMLYEAERMHAPSPLVEAKPNGVTVTLFPPTPYAEERSVDIERDIYYHCCLCYLNRRAMTNSSLRERFGLDDSKTVEISKRIKRLVDAGRLKPMPGAARKNMEYIPYWA